MNLGIPIQLNSPPANLISPPESAFLPEMVIVNIFLVLKVSQKKFLNSWTPFAHNPVRAGLVKANQPLKIYPWSSFPSYVASPGKRIEWVYVDRVLGELGHPKDSRESRQKYGRYMEELAKKWREVDGKREMEEKWKPLRRGWYLGDEAFLSRLWELMGKNLEGKARESYWGDELRGHDERQALKM